MKTGADDLVCIGDGGSLLPATGCVSPLSNASNCSVSLYYHPRPDNSYPRQPIVKISVSVSFRLGIFVEAGISQLSDCGEEVILY